MSDDTLEPAVNENPAVETAGAAEKGDQAKKGKRSFFRELPFLVVLAFVLALLIKQFLIQAFFIPSGSMEHTLNIGDRVLVNKVIYDLRDPKRGEVVVFNGLDNFDEGVILAPPGNGFQKVIRTVTGAIGLGAPDEKDYIKRIIGVPGDRVMCCDPQGRVVVTPAGGKPTALNEPYIFGPDMTDMRYFCAASVKGSSSKQQACPPGAEGIEVPKGRLWVMGDHRGDSADSRAHVTDANQGTVPQDKVVGRAFTIVYPLGRASLLGVPDTFDAVALPAASIGGGLLGALPVMFLRRRRLRRAS